MLQRGARGVEVLGRPAPPALDALGERREGDRARRRRRPSRSRTRPRRGHARRTARRNSTVARGGCAMALAPLNPETRNLIDGKLVARQQRQHVREREPGHRGGDRRRAPTARKDDMHARDRRRAARLRRDRLVDRPRVPREVPAPAPRGARGGEGAAPRDRGRRGRLAGDCSPTLMQCDDSDRADALLGRARRRATRTSSAMTRHPVHRAPQRPHPAPRGDRRGRRDHALELPALPEPREARARARGRAARSCSSPRPTRRGRRRTLGRLIAEQHRHPAGRREHRRVLRPPGSARSSRPTRASTSSPSRARPRPAGASWSARRRR